MLLSVALFHGCLLLTCQLHGNVAISEEQSEAIKNDNCTRYISQGTGMNGSYVANVSTLASLCPPWYSWSEGGCNKGPAIKGVVYFQSKTGQTRLSKFNCMTTSYGKGRGRVDVAGGCLASVQGQSPTMSSFPVPCNISLLNEYMCAGLNREGQLCGRCVKGFAPPVYSYSLSCVNCTDHHLNWLRYIGMAFGPLTLFCLFICFFLISVTSPYLHGFVFSCEILTAHTFMRLIVNSNGFNPSNNSASTIMLSKIYLGLVTIWNLDFFSTIYEPFCLSLNVTVVQALALNYLVALYPLFLVLVAYVLVRMYSNNVRCIVAAWKPFRAVLRPFMQNLGIQTSLIESFATLFFLSAMKVQNVTIDVLAPTTLLFANGTQSTQLYVYLAGDVEYFGKNHLPYGIVALLFLVVFTIIPALLFFLYPCSFFQKWLNMTKCNSLALKTFMDVFQGNFKDGTNSTADFRYFSGIFFCVRFINTASFLLLNSPLFWTISTAIITVLGFSIAIFHPQKTRIHYVLDLLGLMIVLLVMLFVTELILQHTNSISREIDILFRVVALGSPLIYIAGLMCYWTIARKRIPQKIISCMAKNRRNFFRRTQQHALLL